MIKESLEQEEPCDVDDQTRSDKPDAALESMKLAWKNLSKNQQREFREWLLSDQEISDGK